MSVRRVALRLQLPATVRGRALVPLLALAVAVASVGAAADAPLRSPAQETARRAVHLLDYIAVDYAEAVRDGAVVDDFEYAEQLEFLDQVGRHFAELDIARRGELAAQLGALRQAVEQFAPEDTVVEAARALSDRVRGRFDVRAALTAAPAAHRGEALYAEHCASCHGPGGGGDGPAGVGLDPPPTDFTDRQRMGGLSPFALFNTVSYGIEGTAMVSYAESLSELERFDIAFFVSQLASGPTASARGAARAAAAPERIAQLVSDVEELIQKPPRAFGDDPETQQLRSYLLADASVLARGQLPLEIARERLREAQAAHAAGESDRALELAISAYLDGFEHVEPVLATVAPAVAREVEGDFAAYRNLLGGSATRAELDAQYEQLHRGLDRAAAKLEPESISTGGIFASSAAILFREGLEAVLLVGAILGIATRFGQPGVLRFIHLGWVAALAAGAITWVISAEVIALSGAQREVVEGVTALVATAVLCYVSVSLIAQAETERWQAFLENRLRQALGRSSPWALGAVSFLAVYREAFETVLFYQALVSQVGAGRGDVLLGGGAAAALALFGVTWGLWRLGRRLPLRQFFTASSVLLFLLALVLAGRGVAALQEAAWVPQTAIPLPRFDWFGIYPTLEGVALQLLLVVVALPWFVRLLPLRAAVR